ncbi:MAG: TIM barrel protein [Candidatus Thorarchaeota archaeon]
MPFRIGLTIQGLGELTPSTLIKLGNVIALEHIEFDVSVFTDLEDVKQVIKAKQTAIHAPYSPDYKYDLSFPSEDADQLVTAILKAKADLNIIGVVVHSPKETNDLFYERVSQLPFPLLENIPNQSWDTFMAFRDKVRENSTKNFGYCFDIPHSFITNGDAFLDVPPEVMTSLKRKSGYIHISGGKRHHDQHFPLVTEGDIPFHEIKSFLKDIQFSGTVTMELVPRSLEDVSKMLKSYSIMLNVAGKRFQSLVARLKAKIVMYRMSKYKDQINSELKGLKTHFDDYIESQRTEEF